MEKISGILPEKPRLKSENEKMVPVRPGAPSFGRPEGSIELRDKVTLSSIKNIGPQETQTFRNLKEAQNVKIVDELSRKFFSSQAKNQRTTEPSQDTNLQNSTLTKVLTEEPIHSNTNISNANNTSSSWKPTNSVVESKNQISKNEAIHSREQPPNLPIEYSVPRPLETESLDYYA